MTLQIRNDALVELMRADFYSRDDELVLSDDRWIELDERSPAPALPVADRIRLFARDDGGGNSQFCFIDAAGNVVCSGGGVAAPHNILSATHTDAVVQAVSRGSLIYGDATPAWNELVHPGADYVLGTDANDVLWKLATTSVPLPPVAEGDIIIASAVPAWSILTIGAQFTHLEAGAATATWVANLTMQDDATIGLNAGGNLDFNSTPATDVLNFASCDVGVNEVAPDANLHVSAATATDIGAIFQTSDNNTAQDLTQWQNAAGGVFTRVTADGHIGIGSAPGALGLFIFGHRSNFTHFTSTNNENTLAVSMTYTGVAGSAFGFTGNAFSGNAAGAINLTGVFFTAVHLSAGDITELTAHRGRALQSGAGTGTTATFRGVVGDLNFQGDGAVTTAYALSAVIAKSGTNVIGTLYGLHIPSVTVATNNFAIFTNAGSVFLNNGLDASTDLRMSSDNQTHMLFVDSGFDSVLINSSADLSSTFGVVTTAAADIGVVIRGSAAQSANLVEYQDSTTAIFFESGDGLTGSITTWNQQGVDIDYVIEAVGVADAFVVDGAAGQITLGALGAGVVQSTAGGVLSSGAVPLVDIAGYAQGSIIIGGAADWEALAHPGAAGYALISDATELVWDLTPNWLGDHTWTSATATKPILTLENTNADGNSPQIDFYKNTASPLDGDNLSLLQFFGETSTGAKERYAFMVVESLDVTNADTGGGFRFEVVMNAVERNLFEIAGYNGAVNQGEVIVNQDGQDVDFRVEAVGVGNALFVRGSDGEIGINEGTPTGRMHITQAITFPALVLEAGANGEIATPDGDAIRWGHWNSGTTTFTERFNLDGVGDINIASGTDVVVPDNFFIGLGAAAGRIDFDDQATDEINFLSCFVGIGTSTPGGMLHLESTGDVLAILDADSDNSGENDNPRLELRQDGEAVIGGLGFVGDAGQIFTNSLENAMYVVNDFATSDLQLGANNTAVLTILRGGDVGIGATAGPTANGGQVLFFGDNAADPTMAANTAGFYGKDVAGTVEAFAVDEAGNAAQLTPHNFTLFDPDPSHGYPWSYYAKNEFIGKEINVDLYGAIKAIEALTGGQFIFERDIPKRAWPTEKAPPAWMLERMN